MNGTEAKKSKTKYVFRAVPFSRIAQLLLNGETSHVSLADLESEIELHGFEAMPDSVRTFYHRLLNGEIERRGRKSSTKLEKRLKSHHDRILYRGMYLAVKGDPLALREATSFYEKYRNDLEGYEASIQAWRLVSCLYFGHGNKEKSLRNRSAEGMGLEMKRPQRDHRLN